MAQPQVKHLRDLLLIEELALTRLEVFLALRLGSEEEAKIVCEDQFDLAYELWLKYRLPPKDLVNKAPLLPSDPPIPPVAVG
jgi:hypothetical protein